MREPGFIQDGRQPLLARLRPQPTSWESEAGVQPYLRTPSWFGVVPGNWLQKF